MKQFENPEIKVIEIAVEDLVAASGYGEECREHYCAGDGEEFL